MRRILVGKLASGGWLMALVLGLWLALAWPLVTGERTLILRDVMTSHLPLKSFGAVELAAGRIPAMNPHWAGGQPFRGNPNALPFYPGNLLYLVLPFWSAFGLHYVAHWLLAFLGMRRLGRELGQSREGALVAALAYAGGGYVLTTLTFMNLLTVAAWAPWMLAGLARGGRRGNLLAGLGCGLMLLGGEPITAALTVPAMAVVAVDRHGPRRGLGGAALAGLIGLAVALPQLVATARVLPFSYRSAHGLDPAQVVTNALHPARLLELVWPLPWGWPAELGRFAYWAPAVTPQTPYIYSIHLGLIAFVLALAAAPRRRAWAALAGLALVAAWALGLDAELSTALTFGLFRYPQKLVFLAALAGAVLAGFGLDRALAAERPERVWLAVATASGAVAAALFVGQGRWSVWLRDHLVVGHSMEIARTQAAHWLVLAAAAGVLAFAAAWAARRRSAAGLALLQLLAVLQLAPAWLTDRADPYRSPATLSSALPEPRRLAQVAAAFPEWEPRGRYDRGAFTMIHQARIARADLEPAFGVLDSIDQVLAPDLDGLTSPLTVFLHRNLALADWPVRLRWLRRTGATAIVRTASSSGPGLAPVASEERYGARTELAPVPLAAPPAEWPERVVVASSPIVAWRLVAHGELTESTAVASRALEHRPGGAVLTVSESPDRIELEVDSPGGLAVVRRAFWPLYRARLGDGTRLRLQPVDVAWMGVEVPPGRHRVVIWISSRPELAALAAAFAVAIGAASMAWRHP